MQFDGTKVPAEQNAGQPDQLSGLRSGRAARLRWVFQSRREWPGAAHYARTWWSVMR